jgi:hypothetical protein
MRSLLVQGEIDATEIAAVLPTAGAKVQTAVGYAFGATRIALYIGRKYTFRSNDYLGIILLAASDGTTQRIDVSYAGGGSGMLGVVWGAGTDLENEVLNAISQVASRLGLRCTEVASGASEP